MSLEQALLKTAEAAAHLEQTLKDGREGWRDTNAQLMNLNLSISAMRAEVREYRDEMNLRDAAHTERHAQVMAALERLGARHG